MSITALPDELRDAVLAFDAGPRPAATAATRWLHAAAQEPPSARARVLVREGRVLAFYALASSEVRLTQRDRRRLGIATTYPYVGASVIAWTARIPGEEASGLDILRHAIAKAREANELQATFVLALDAFDDDVEQLWVERYGFRRSARDPAVGWSRHRLWLPLTTEL